MRTENIILKTRDKSSGTRHCDKLAESSRETAFDQRTVPPYLS